MVSMDAKVCIPLYTLSADGTTHCGGLTILARRLIALTGPCKEQAVILHFDSPGFTPWLKKRPPQLSGRARNGVMVHDDLQDSLNVLKRGGPSMPCLPHVRTSQQT
eukprot:4639539-Amphidinium_carterae.1